MVPADRRIPLSQRQRTGDDIDRFDLSFISANIRHEVIGWKSASAVEVSLMNRPTASAAQLRKTCRPKRHCGPGQGKTDGYVSDGTSALFSTLGDGARSKESLLHFAVYQPRQRLASAAKAFP
jgi:hypothetical protein